jgi:hypothetical protein
VFATVRVRALLVLPEGIDLMEKINLVIWSQPIIVTNRMTAHLVRAVHTSQLKAM